MSLIDEGYIKAYGLREQYDPEKYEDLIYFATDTHEIILNDKVYGTTQEALNALEQRIQELESKQYTLVKEENNAVEEMYIDESSEFFDIYTKEQVDDKLAQRMTWQELSDLVRIWPYIEGNPIKKMTQEEYFTMAEIDPDVAYIVYADKDGSLYAVYKDDEALWVCKDVSLLFEGQLAPGFTYCDITYKYVGESVEHTDTIYPDEGQWFSHKFEKPISSFMCKTPATSSQIPLYKVTQLPTASEIRGLAQLLMNQKNMVYFNPIGFGWGPIFNERCAEAFQNNFRLKVFRKLHPKTGDEILINNTIHRFIWGSEDLEYIDLSNWNTDESTYGSCFISEFFSGCRSLKKIKFGPKFTLRNFNKNYCYGVFQNTYALKELDISMWDLSNKAVFREFLNGSGIETLHINTRIPEATNLDNFFTGCSSLTNVVGELNDIPISLSLKDSPLLTADSCMVFINGLMEDKVGQSLTLHRDAYDRLSEEQLAVATSKGWSVVRY